MSAPPIVSGPRAGRDDTDGDEGEPLVRALRRRLLGSSLLYLCSTLAVLFVGFSIAAPNAFLTAYNIRTVVTVASVLLVVSVGSTFVIATAGIDLSVGSVLVISGVTAIKAMEAVGGQGAGTVLVGLLAALLSGLAWGTVNGLVVARLKVPALIATLGSMGAALGIAELITGGSDLNGVPTTLFRTIGLGRLLGVVPWIVVIAVAITAGAGLLLTRTRFGLHTLFIGSNPEASRRAGIDVTRHLTKVYALAGTLAGLAGFLDLALYASANIAGHNSDNLQAVTAVVLGGTSLFGGTASVLGTVIGVFIPAVLQNGFVIVKVQTFWQEVVIGTVLVAAVYLDQLKRSARERA
ncbi:ABC transporter permease [Kitasatospora sp. NPDC057015]|uniref:ABC transporter permease n=1 Tax=Kitasatospora sp. NPDC057015 TaxID=3346001 RepID=UPI003630B349